MTGVQTCALPIYAGSKPKHGQARNTKGSRPTPEYAAWQHMRDRCYNPRNTQYKHYGARGIQVCSIWRESFESFFRDVGLRPSKDHSLGRIDNDKGYEPGNVRWETDLEQNINSRHVRWIDYKTIRKPLTHWCKELEIKPTTIINRAKRKGMTHQEAFDFELTRLGIGDKCIV